MKPPTIVADIGCNHRGDLQTALRMVEILATYCTEHFLPEGRVSPPVCKFQKRSDMSLYVETPHPNAHQAYGPTYRAHREALELSIDQHRELKEHAEALGAVYSCSVWDMQAAREVVSLNPAMIKIPSARNDWPNLIDYLCGEHRGELHISLGMLTHQRIADLVGTLADRGRLRDSVLYACTSGYPVNFEDACINEVDWLKTQYGSLARGIGYSGHHLGIALDVAVAAKGVSHIERHFTLNRSWKGTDHAASLEPDGIRRIMRDTTAAAVSLRMKPDGLPACERETADKLRVYAD